MTETTPNRWHRLRAGLTPAAAGGLPQAVVLVLAVFILLQVALALHRAFDPDEWLALHGSWCIVHGQVPYKDYF